MNNSYEKNMVKSNEVGYRQGCAPTEHRAWAWHRLTPSCAFGLHGVIHIRLLRRRGGCTSHAAVALGYCLNSFALYESRKISKWLSDSNLPTRGRLCESGKTPKAFNVNNPVQAEGAARGKEASHAPSELRRSSTYRLLCLYFLIICTLIFSSCERPEKTGSIELLFTHTINDQPIQWNLPIYTNAAGNQYQVNEIKYFISKIRLVDTKGKWITLKQDDGIHYVDCSLENTLRWTINEIPQRRYTQISFVFGLNENDNRSNRFVNPPESNFFWPDHLGGGYHYMQINGKFRNKNDTLQNMNIHTGIGQLRNEHNEITQFVHNYFTVTLPVEFSVSDDKILPIITLNMEIQRWFDTPNVYDIEEFGSGIMQNQQAQELLKENGWNVFKIIPFKI